MNRDIEKGLKMEYKEEQELIKEYQTTGNKTILNKLVEQHLPFIHSKAIKMGKTGDLVDELFHEGVIGFINAINNFDVTKELRLSTYAGNCASFAMMTYVKKNTGVVSIGYKSNAYSLIMTQLSRIDTIGWSHRDVVNFSEKNKFNLNDVLTVLGVRNSSDSDILEYILRSDVNVEEQCELEELAERADQILTLREKECLNARYLNPAEIDNVAERYGLNKGYVRTLGVNAYKKLVDMGV